MNAEYQRLDAEASEVQIQVESVMSSVVIFEHHFPDQWS